MRTVKIDEEGRIKLPKSVLKALGAAGSIEIHEVAPDRVELRAKANPANGRDEARERSLQDELALIRSRFARLRKPGVPDLSDTELEQAIAAAQSARAADILKNARD